jgi:hypothetical protein
VAPPDLDAWEPWPPGELAARLAGTDVPWCVAGGWALDLWYGEQTRAHGDIELALPRTDFALVRPYFAGFELYDAGGGEVRRLDDGATPEYHQCWVLDPVAGRWRTDIFLEPGDGRTWVSHRDGRIRRPYRDAIGRTAGGIPYLRPELVLFTKAEHPRDKDEADLATALPRLDPAARRWLAGALTLVYRGHAWLARLDTPAGR